MEGLLFRTDLGEYDKAKQYLELQNRNLTLKHQLNTKPQQSDEMKRGFASHPEDNLSTIVQEPSAVTAATTSTPLNPFITTPSPNLAPTRSTCHTTTLKSIRLGPSPHSSNTSSSTEAKTTS